VTSRVSLPLPLLRSNGAPAASGGDTVAEARGRAAELAAQFEGLLLARMLQEMRKAGRWSDGEGESGLGAETLLETVDVELATYLARAQGLGLARQLLDVLETADGARNGIRDPGGASRAMASPAIEPTMPAAARIETKRSDSASGPAAARAGTVLLDRGQGRAVTSTFGWRHDPIDGHVRFHRGIDLRAAYGALVASPAAGRVVFAGVHGGYGLTVVVEHPGGVRTRYAHLSAAEVSVGDAVRAGQVIGRAGQSGRATGPHLHFEVLVEGEPVDPQPWLRVLKPTTTVADSRIVSGTDTTALRGEDHEG
jgi:murein DD-endopeptidase MepM/ murein hydrolase activator NlpD